MVFTSIEFLLFFPWLFGLYYLLPQRIKNYYLLAVGLVFCAWGDVRSMGVLVASIFINYILVLRMQEFNPGSAARKLVLALDVLINVGILFSFKYLRFAMEALGPLLRMPPNAQQAPGGMMPIGISFYTFKSISYAIEAYRGEISAQRDIGYFGMYLSFFPQLIAGPIARYSSMEGRMSDRRSGFPAFADGLTRFIVGFNKKILLADVLAKTADIAFASTKGSVCLAWLGAVCYSLQIYYDFSGYSDMAIGLAGMLGFDTAENFDYPYASLTITEFWRRWHISLGTWFRDYVYFPLGGSRVKRRSRVVFNLLVVWMLTGIWHGANWTFIAWGLMYGVVITVEKLTRIPQRLARGKAWLRLPYRAFSLLIIVVGWVLFRSDSIERAIQYLGTMFGLSGKQLIDGAFLFNMLDNRIYVLAGILFSMPVCRLLRERVRQRSALAGSTFDWVYAGAQIVLFIVSVSSLVVSAHNPPVYMNF